MSPEEVKASLKSMIDNLIKDDPEAAQTNFHDVLAAKMKDKVSPPAEDTVVAADGDDKVSVETSVVDSKVEEEDDEVTPE